MRGVRSVREFVLLDVSVVALILNRLPPKQQKHLLRASEGIEGKFQDSVGSTLNIPEVLIFKQNVDSYPRCLTIRVLVAEKHHILCLCLMQLRFGNSALRDLNQRFIGSIIASKTNISLNHSEDPAVRQRLLYGVCRDRISPEPGCRSPTVHLAWRTERCAPSTAVGVSVYESHPTARLRRGRPRDRHGLRSRPPQRGSIIHTNSAQRSLDTEREPVHGVFRFSY